MPFSYLICRTLSLKPPDAFLVARSDCLIGGVSISRNATTIKQNGKDTRDAKRSYYIGRCQHTGIVGL
ncbi:hypothetical protein C7967_102219 [Thalassospira sp. 11-3]|jgi:hypothetical protein|nr:hypothetical protein KO164_0853 [Thalassospira sp. KO164]PXX34164.1 hypothetical protein C7967_102219 [Thalassospira sp. 11-3]SED79555.1 hypothetical protein SAMN04515623_0857 [Thalassospira permensis]